MTHPSHPKDTRTKCDTHHREGDRFLLLLRFLRRKRRRKRYEFLPGGALKVDPDRDRHRATLNTPKVSPDSERSGYNIYLNPGHNRCLSDHACHDFLRDRCRAYHTSNPCSGPPRGCVYSRTGNYDIDIKYACSQYSLHQLTILQRGYVQGRVLLTDAIHWVIRIFGIGWTFSGSICFGSYYTAQQTNIK